MPPALINPVRDCVCPRARHRHGTRGAYNIDGCRCFPCRVAHSRYVFAQRHDEPFGAEYPLVPNTATRLRLQALGAIGHSRTELGAYLGVSGRRVQTLRQPDQLIHPRVADDVEAMYDVLWHVRPSGRHADITRTHARRLGWLPPLALDDDALRAATPEDIVHIGYDVPVDQDAVIVDEVAVERAMHGDVRCATPVELSQAVAKLTAMGYSAAQIADRLGVSSRTITRKRAAA